MSKPDRFARAVEPFSHFNIGERDAIAMLLRRHFAAIRRKVQQYKANAPYHSGGNSLPYRKACDDILTYLDAWRKAKP
jgi:hypothetical protein